MEEEEALVGEDEEAVLVAEVAAVAAPVLVFVSEDVPGVLDYLAHSDACGGLGVTEILMLEFISNLIS